MEPKEDKNQCALACENGVSNAKFVSVGFSKETCRKALVKMSCLLNLLRLRGFWSLWLLVAQSLMCHRRGQL